MIIQETSAYKRDVKRKLENKNKYEELEALDDIKVFLQSKKNMKEVMDDPVHNLYGIEQKHGNLKEFFTAKLNNKIRLKMKPLGEYPYNLIEIEEISFNEIDDHHYGEG